MSYWWDTDFKLHHPQELPLAQRYLDYLRRCHRSISKQVAFHLVYPVEHPPEPSSDDLVCTNFGNERRMVSKARGSK